MVRRVVPRQLRRHEQPELCCGYEGNHCELGVASSTRDDRAGFQVISCQGWNIRNSNMGGR